MREIVKEFLCIYNRSTAQFKDKHLKSNAWKEIAALHEGEGASVDSCKQRYENRWNVEGTSSCVDDEQCLTASSTGKTTPARETASVRKLCDQAAGKSDDLENYFRYKLIELSSLSSVFQPLHQCHARGELTTRYDVARTYGNSSVIEIECSLRNGHQ
jgi:hypothetical protein